jgi:hypothetical protein
MTHTLDLPGLREDILRDHLAALGLLEWITFLFPVFHPKLAWSADSGHPFLHTSQPLPEDWHTKLLDGLQTWRTIQPNPLGHGKIEAIAPQTLRDLLNQTTDPRVIRFYCGITSQLLNEGSGRRSELIIESANRSVLKGVDDLLADRRKPLNFAADLNGTGPRREVNNTSRWHPSEYQPAAHAATDPKENKHQDWVCLNILALFGVSFHPVLDTAKGRSTVGYRRINRINEFSWPTWQHPLTIDEVRALVSHPSIHEVLPDMVKLSSLGIHRIWRSRKFSPDGKNDYFSAAMPV